MGNKSILFFINQLGRAVFTTREVAMMSGRSLSVTTQTLRYLEREGLVLKVYRGIWATTGKGNISPYSMIPFLFPRQRAYVSFVSALHLYGIIEQVPQVIMLASIAHTKVITTKLGTFSVHRLAPLFFTGYDWYKGTGNFLIAEQEKAFVDSLYLSACKKKLYSYFPELHFPQNFRVEKVRMWSEKIPNPRIRGYVLRKLEGFDWRQV